MTQQPRIYLHDLRKTFGAQAVLNGIDFSVNPGEIVGLIGPSGAGKSTAIKTMLGMEKADSGKALVLNQKMPNRRVLGDLGYMAQSDALYESLSAAENLKFYAEMKGLDKTQLHHQIAHVAQVVELTDHLTKRVSGFSGGMKRRLSLAIALLGEPELLILDEPTVGIDPALRRQIWHELHRLRDGGTSILVTTHVMDEAELVDKVGLLMQSKIQVFGTPAYLEQRYHVKTIEDVFLKVEGELQ